MKVFTVSDLHIDYKPNADWLFGLSTSAYKSDILILAGDISDDIGLLKRCFHHLQNCFYKVLYVPGNHDLWTLRDADVDSLDKFYQILKISSDYGILTDVYDQPGLSIVPMFSWYDFSFDAPNEMLKLNWMDFYACKWSHCNQKITEIFLQMNERHLHIKNELVISFSHFLPTIELISGFMPEKYRYLFPVMGTTSLKDQLSVLRPDIHIYGHNHFRQSLKLDDITYINNAYGYPHEQGLTAKKLLSIHEV